jgi:hypothetical protein
MRRSIDAGSEAFGRIAQIVIAKSRMPDRAVCLAAARARLTRGGAIDAGI